MAKRILPQFVTELAGLPVNCRRSSPFFLQIETHHFSAKMGLLEIVYAKNLTSPELAPVIRWL
jgi:hypothetical protein